jgi:hypothetical protein
MSITEQRWEYLVVPIEDAGRVKKGVDLRPDHLNELGAQGGRLSVCHSRRATSSPGRSPC